MYVILCILLHYHNIIKVIREQQFNHNYINNINENHFELIAQY